MLRLKLKEAMLSYNERHGKRVTYDWLAEQTGLSKATIESIASRPTYDTRLSTVDRLCNVLECKLTELVEFTAEPQDSKKTTSG